MCYFFKVSLISKDSLSIKLVTPKRPMQGFFFFKDNNDLVDFLNK